MISALLQEWVRKLDRQFHNQERKIALLIDNCSVHPRVESLTSLNLFFLPPNTTSVLQPIGQGL